MDSVRRSGATLHSSRRENQNPLFFFIFYFKLSCDDDNRKCINPQTLEEDMEGDV